MATTNAIADAKPEAISVALASQPCSFSEVTLVIRCGYKEAERIVEIAHGDYLDVIARDPDHIPGAKAEC